QACEIGVDGDALSDRDGAVDRNAEAGGASAADSGRDSLAADFGGVAGVDLSGVGWDLIGILDWAIETQAQVRFPNSLKSRARRLVRANPKGLKRKVLAALERHGCKPCPPKAIPFLELCTVWSLAVRSGRRQSGLSDGSGQASRLPAQHRFSCMHRFCRKIYSEGSVTLVQVVELNETKRSAPERTVDHHKSANLARSERVKSSAEIVKDVLGPSLGDENVIAAGRNGLILTRLKCHALNQRIEASNT